MKGKEIKKGRKQNPTREKLKSKVNKEWESLKVNVEDK